MFDLIFDFLKANWHVIAISCVIVIGVVGLIFYALIKLVKVN